MIRQLFPEQLQLPEVGPHASRIIAVVGAGGSAPALPLSDHMVKDLIESDPDKNGYKSELRRLTRVHRLEVGDFETQLAALSRVPELERRVRERINERYSVRHPTVLAYELLAHLLKHRFVDAIISFNFDELLDQSLWDELGAGEFVAVVSEGDCHGVQFDPDADDYLPVYVKLHGTASDPESLRFTRDAYYSQRPAIETGIRTLLGTGATLINIGSSLSSFEFVSLLSSPRDLTVFTLTRGGLRPGPKTDIEKERQDKETRFVDLTAAEWSSSRDWLSGADLLLYGLVDLLAQIVENESDGVLRLHPVSRHLLIVELMGCRAGLESDRPAYAQYLRDRTVLEFAFSAVKGRGVVAIESLVRDRCASYFDLYKQKASRPETWPSMCRAGGLIQASVAGETYVADDDICRPRPAGPLRSRVNRQIDLLALSRQLARELRADDSHLPKSNRSRRIGQVFRDIQACSEIEIGRWDESVCAKTFVAPRTLRSLTSLQAQTYHALQYQDYDELAVISETGEWLLQSPAVEVLPRRARAGNLRIYLIAAYLQHVDALKETYGSQISLRYLDWWRHNRHMTILFSGDTPREAIYFTRRLRIPFITPVYLNRHQDLEMLATEFKRYWEQTFRESDKIPPEELPKTLGQLRGASGRIRKHATRRRA